MSKRAFFCVVAIILGFGKQAAFAWFQLRPSIDISRQEDSTLSRLAIHNSCVNRYDESGGECLTSDCSTSCIEAEPTPTPTPRPSPGPSPHASPSPVPTVTPSPTPSPSPSPNLTYINDSIKVDINHIFELVRLTRIAADGDPERMKAMSKELFTLAFRMPVGWDRIAEEKNALVPLSKVDPQLAIELLSKVENPEPHPRTMNFPEDVRADAATYIFPNYWYFAGEQGLVEIRNLAKYIGDTGEYPYRAIGVVLDDISKSRNIHGKEVSGEIFMDAVAYYQRRSKFLNTNEEFLEFLRKTRFAVPMSHYILALRIFVNRLTSEESKNTHYVAEISTSTGTFRFHDENESLLFQAFPLIFEIDRSWAAEMIARYSNLRHATGKVIYRAAGVIVGKPPESQLSRLQDDVLQLALGHTLEELQQTNPSQALLLAKKLSNRQGSLFSFVGFVGLSHRGD